MKWLLIIVLLFLAGLSNAQTMLGTPVKLARQAGTIREFLEDLNKAPGISLSFSSEAADLERRVTLTGTERTLEDHLRIIFNSQPVRFVESNGKVFIVPAGPPKKRVTISGFVTDRTTGERLIGASVFFPLRQTGTVTNDYGFYSITLVADSLEMQTSYAGYFTRSEKMMLQDDVQQNILMERNEVIPEMIIVNAESRSNSQYKALPGRATVSPAFIRSAPAMFAESDVMKTLQLLPGIQAGNEGTAGLNVRGGSADQNLILMDGMPVYNASHAFGLFSVFNADAVNNIEVYKTAFPASFGGRLSSVIDVHLREGDKNKFSGEGGIGLIFSRLTLEGPIRKGRSSFLVSARRTYADVIIRPFLKLSDSETDVVPFFTDLNAKANFPIGEDDRVYVSLYMGKDKFRLDETDDDSKYRSGFWWGNTTAMTRWNHIFTNRLFSNFTVTYSRYRFQSTESEEQRQTDPRFAYRSGFDYRSGIRDVSAKADLDFRPSPRHSLKAGFVFTHHRYDPGIASSFEKDSFSTTVQNLGNEVINSNEFDLYAEDDIRISRRIKANIGARFSGFQVKGKTFTSLQPRLSALYKINSYWSVKASYARMNQFIHLLTNNTMGLPTDLWVPVTPGVPPQESDHFATGVSYGRDKTLQASMELYYKKMRNVIEYGERWGFSNSTYSWEDMIETGQGVAMGIEWLVQKTEGKITGIASYALSKSDRKFRNIDEGRRFPFRYDRRHELKAAVIWKRSSRFEASASWFFSSGAAISIPTSYYYDPFSFDYIDVYESRNNARLPAYHRLDLSVKFIRQKKKYQRSWVVSIYNVYNRQNTFFRYKDYEEPGNRVVFKDVTVFPILPSISYQFKF